MTGRRPIRVVGVGSPNGDDAVGWRVIDALIALDPGVECVNVCGGQELLDLMEDCEALFVVDALVSGQELGTVYRLDGRDRRILHMRPGSTHDLGPAAAIELAATLGIAPRTMVIYAIEIGPGLRTSKPTSELSPAVAAAVPQLARRITEDIATCRKSVVTPPAGSGEK